MNIYDQPEDQACGCLPRESKFGELCAAFEDHVEVIPHEEWGQYIDNGVPDFRPFIKHIFSQGRVSSCTCEAISQAVASMYAFRNNGEYILLNPWSLYAFVTSRDNGSSIDVATRRAQTHGILPEAIWPRRGPDAHAWNDKPPQDLFDKYALRAKEAYDIGTTDDVGTASIMGFGIVYGWKPGPRSGHAEFITSLLNPNTAEDCNSWDITFGDKGFGKRPLGRINFGFGAVAIRTVVNMAAVRTTA